MRSTSRQSPGRLALLAAALLLVALGIGGSTAALAFGMGGFGRMGGFARPAPRIGDGLRTTTMRRHRGDRVAGPPRRQRRPPTEGGGHTGRRHPVGGIEIGRTEGVQLPTATGERGGGGAGGTGAGAGGNNGSGLPARGERRFVPDQVIVEFAANASPLAIRRLARRYALTQLESQNFPLIGARLFLWHVGGRRSVASIVAALSGRGIVAGAQPNYIFTLNEQLHPSAGSGKGDPAQYVLSKLQVEQAQLIATGKNVPVAVIDSEIDDSQPDIDGSIARSYDALGGDVAPQLHGTEIAGAIAAHGKLLGIAPGARLLAVRAFDAHGGGTSFAIYKSLEWAADNGARIVNMSFAGPADLTLHRMLAAAAARSIVLVAAVGNAGSSSAPLYPAADPSVIAVTATDIDDHVFHMANRGRYIAVAAPGVDILALAPGGAFAITTGTSVAAAHVTGVVALLLQHDASLTPVAVRAILMMTAKPLEPASNSEFGAGLVNAYHAMTVPQSKAVGDAGGHAQRPNDNARRLSADRPN